MRSQVVLIIVLVAFLLWTAFEGYKAMKLTTILSFILLATILGLLLAACDRDRHDTFVMCQDACGHGVECTKACGEALAQTYNGTNCWVLCDLPKRAKDTP